MTFHVAADAYDRFMGRFSFPLAGPFVAAAGVAPADRVLDVGAGTGALTAELLAHGAGHVTAVDPSAPFVAALRERRPCVDVRQASAEELPFPDGAFDASLAQLVVHFMADPVRGLREMARVTRPSGVVAACVWDHASGGPLRDFWAVARALTPGAADESERPGTREGQLAALLRAAGLDDVRDGALTIRVGFGSFEEWWEPFTLGVGPAGAYVAALDDAGRAAFREECARRLPAEGFEISARAWYAVGRVP